jgi:hypothetical protein
MLNSLIPIIASSGGAAAAAGAYESIATVNGNGSATTLTFSSIPSTYVALQIRGIANDANGFNIALQFNGDTGSNYAFHRLLGNGSTVSAAGFATQTYANYIGACASATSIFSAHIVDIHDYASTTKAKTIRTFTGADANGSGPVSLSSGLWTSTSAITSISLVNTGPNAFITGSSFALYGIKGA